MQLEQSIINGSITQRLQSKTEGKKRRKRPSGEANNKKSVKPAPVASVDATVTGTDDQELGEHLMMEEPLTLQTMEEASISLSAL